MTFSRIQIDKNIAVERGPDGPECARTKDRLHPYFDLMSFRLFEALGQLIQYINIFFYILRKRQQEKFLHRHEPSLHEFNHMLRFQKLSCREL